MSLWLALALAVSGQQQTDTSITELTKAFEFVETESVERVSEEKIASEAARFMNLTFELGGSEGAPPAVKDEKGLLAYFTALRSRTSGRLDERRLVEEAINGMSNATGHGGGYVDLERDARLQAAGRAGTGLSVKQEDGVPTIVSMAKGSASEGLFQKGDVILKVDGHETRGQPIDDLVTGLRGQPGSVVTLTVRRQVGAPFDVKVTRALVTMLPSVTWRVEGPVGIIAVSRFDRDTLALTRTAIEAIGAQLVKPAGYLIDLRGNQGGLLDAVVGFADIFMERGGIGGQRGRERSDVERYWATDGDLTGGLPLVVLIDHETAAGAEIVAAALKESHRARLVGQRTLGRGTIHSIIPLSRRTAIRVPTGAYFTALNQPIEAVGVLPDVEVPLSENAQDQALALLAPKLVSTARPEANITAPDALERSQPGPSSIEEAAE